MKMDDSSFNLDISVGNVQECPPQRRNIYGSVVSAYFRIDIILAVRLSTIASFLQSAESVPAPEGNAREPIGEEPNRSFCDCKSACKPSRRMESAVAVLVARQIYHVCRTGVNVALVENNVPIG